MTTQERLARDVEREIEGRVKERVVAEVNRIGASMRCTREHCPDPEAHAMTFTRWYWSYLTGLLCGGALVALLLAFMSLGR